MSSLIRFSNTNERGPSGALWNNIVDWVHGTMAVNGGVMDAEDYFPYNAGDLLDSQDSGHAITVSAVPYGVISCTASAGTYPTAGYVRNAYVDLTSIKEVCTEAKIQRTAGATGADISAVGFTDQVPEAVFHSDGTVDGGSGEDQLLLVWNDDLTVDLVSVVNSTATILIAEVATAVSNATSHKFGIRVKKETSTNYTVYASVDGVVKKVTATTTSLTQVAMRPVAVTTCSATDAPVMTVDWHFTCDATPS